MSALRFQACHIRTDPSVWSVFVAEQDGKAAGVVVTPAPHAGRARPVLPVLMLEAPRASAEHAVRSNAP